MAIFIHIQESSDGDINADDDDNENNDDGIMMLLKLGQTQEKNIT